MGVNNRRYFIPAIIILALISLSAVALRFTGKLLGATPPGSSSPASLPLVSPAGVDKGSAEDTLPSKSTLVPPPDSPGSTAPMDGSPSASGTQAEINVINQQITEMRGLNQYFVIPQVLITQDEMVQHISTLLDAQFSNQEQQAGELLAQALGLLQPGQDIRKIYLDIFSRGIKGLYDPFKKTLYLVEDPGNSQQLITYAHEYVHAIQDQNYNLVYGLKFDAGFCHDQNQRCFALQALLEGDANFTQQEWLQKSGSQETNPSGGELVDPSDPLFDTLPDYLKQDFFFPYQAGTEFVASLWNQGGWKAVNAAYQNPPLSSEQIMHPDHYPDDKPRRVQLPEMESLLGSGWKLVNQDTLGEWYTYLTLAYGADKPARQADEIARQAAAGWEGDQYALFTGPSGQSAFVMVQLWDTSQDSQELLAAMLQYGSTRWGKPLKESSSEITWQADQQAVIMARNNTYTFWIMSPDLTQTTAIANLLQTP